MRDRRYRCSAARLEALERLSLLGAGVVDASRSPVPTSVREMAFQSAIFQASATLEVYLKQIFDFWLFELKARNKQGNHLPQRARLSFLGRELSEAFGKFAYAGDEKVLAESLGRKMEVMMFTAGDSDVPKYLTGEFVYKDRKYPSPANIKRLYARIGCDDVFDQLSAKMKTDAKLALQSFNDVRTSIAHGVPQGLTLEDVKRNINLVGSVIKSLDRINHREFSKDFGGGVW